MLKHKALHVLVELRVASAVIEDGLRGLRGEAGVRELTNSPALARNAEEPRSCVANQGLDSVKPARGIGAKNSFRIHCSDPRAVLEASTIAEAGAVTSRLGGGLA